MLSEALARSPLGKQLILIRRAVARVDAIRDLSQCQICHHRPEPLRAGCYALRSAIPCAVFLNRRPYCRAPSFSLNKKEKCGENGHLFCALARRAGIRQKNVGTARRRPRGPDAARAVCRFRRPAGPTRATSGRRSASLTKTAVGRQPNPGPGKGCASRRHEQWRRRARRLPDPRRPRAQRSRPRK